MHAHDVDSKKLSAHMGELQRAHVEQNRVIQQLEEGLSRMPLLKSTVRKQEKVIAGLEDLLRKAVQQVKCMRDAEAALQRERQNAENRAVECERRAADAEQRASNSDRFAEECRARLQAATAQAQAQFLQKSALDEQQGVPVALRSQAAQLDVQGVAAAGVHSASLDDAKIVELQQQLKWEQRECESLRNQLHGEQDDKESLRRQLTIAGRESEALRRTVTDLEQQIVELRQRVASAVSDAEALKRKADASDAAAEAADSDLAEVQSPRVYPALIYSSVLNFF
jgi:chromosome segregation ATPase